MTRYKFFFYTTGLFFLSSISAGHAAEESLFLNPVKVNVDLGSGMSAASVTTDVWPNPNPQGNRMGADRDVSSKESKGMAEAGGDRNSFGAGGQQGSPAGSSAGASDSDQVEEGDSEVSSGEVMNQESFERLKYFENDPALKTIFKEQDYLTEVVPEGGSRFVVVEKNANPDDQQALLSAARYARSAGRYEDALDFYNRLLKKNRYDEIVNLEKAVTLQTMGRNEAAIAAYDKVLDINPQSVEARVNMLGLIRKKYPDDALYKLQELYKDNAEMSTIPAQIALIYADKGRYDYAKSYLSAALSLDPKNVNHLFNLAIIEDRLGNVEEALSLYERALSVSNSPSYSSVELPKEKIYDRLTVLRERI